MTIEIPIAWSDCLRLTVNKEQVYCAKLDRSVWMLEPKDLSPRANRFLEFYVYGEYLRTVVQLEYKNPQLLKYLHINIHHNSVLSGRVTTTWWIQQKKDSWLV